MSVWTKRGVSIRSGSGIMSEYSKSGFVLGLALLVLGLLVELLLPLNLVPFQNSEFLGVPAGIFLVFLAAALAFSGIVVLYFAWFRKSADYLDSL